MADFSRQAPLLITVAFTKLYCLIPPRMPTLGRHVSLQPQGPSGLLDPFWVILCGHLKPCGYELTRNCVSQVGKWS
jgi:hypothetical protein